MPQLRKGVSSLENEGDLGLRRINQRDIENYKSQEAFAHGLLTNNL